MSKKLFILSSAGLKNLVTNQNYGDDFKFVFGEHEIPMKNLFAEFVSPYVSQIRQSDPTINSIRFCNKNSTNQSQTNYLSQMSDEVFALFESISKGEKIEIDDKQCFQLQILSILIKNEEMFMKLDELFEKEDDENSEKKINKELKFLSFLEICSESTEVWNRSKSIEYIASHLYSIDADKIIDLPKAVFYSILKNDKLTIDSEDWLLNLIDEFIAKEEKNKIDCSSDDGLSEIDFYEEVNFNFLSDEKFREFIEKVDPNELTSPLWSKIKKCFSIYKKDPPPKPPIKRDGNGFYRQKGENKRYAQNIVACGYDKYRQIGESPNNKDVDGDPIIHPPQNLSLDPSSLLSYSAYFKHSVVVTRSGSLCGIGYNCDGQICSLLEQKEISQFTEFSMKDSNGKQLAPVSALCTYYGTLYMFSKSSGSGRQLVLCDCEINKGTPVFLDIGNHEPVSLFGGYSHSAAICTEGEVIFINRETVKNSPSSPISASSLPGGEKASMVACCKGSIFALSSSGRLFESVFESGSCVLNFSEVSELSGQKIIWLSGTSGHCLAVNSEGRVFGRGYNRRGQLGAGKGISDVPSFTEISSLIDHKIRAAYAGCGISLFETHEGKILACGSNGSGQLFLSSGPNKEDVYSPTETTIASGATFCVAGNYITALFIGGDPPPNMPNTPVKHH